ncbi:uncharacterized protein LOC134257446 [Saccostrea cucullata]|uniref:uncharacterized protein LOC134257446 n=1 Tax=Saccostrea cuccullata TaxID=36930 RepID=UPI002ED3D99F
MKLSFFVVFLWSIPALVCPAQTTLDNLYLGVGYNMVKGNPDGGEWAKLGQDPGLLLTRNILETEIDGSSYIKKTAYPRCTQMSSTSVFYDPESYKEYILHYISTSDNGVAPVSSYAFSANPLYQDIKQKTLTQHDVFRDEITSCTSEHARYVLPVGHVERNLVTQEFARDVCQLPMTYDQSAYKAFIDTWGTHVTIEVDLGARNVTRYRLSISDLEEYLLKLGNDGAAVLKTEPLLGYGSVVQLNMSHLHHSDFPKLPLGSRLAQFSTGFPTKAPISWAMIPISDVIAEKYWQVQDALVDSGICNGINLTVWKNNIERALSEYPTLIGGEVPPSLEIKLPVTWPSGTYALYMPTSGCPTDPLGFVTGYVTQDTEDRSNSNQWTAGIHMQGPLNHDAITTRFCVKQTPTVNEYNRKWPTGNYCIAKKGDCPYGFGAGYLHWDDEDGRNENHHGGILPDGGYSHNTDIWYCCRQDGHPQTKILLPIDAPFYLLRFTSECQQVLGMQVREEVIFFDDEDGANKDKCGGAHPFVDSGCSHANMRLHFCYYSMKPNQTAISIPGILG